MLVNMLESDETPEHNDHTPEGDYYSSYNSPPPSPQSQSSPPLLSPRYSFTSSPIFQTLAILPTTVFKVIRTVYSNLAGFLHP